MEDFIVIIATLFYTIVFFGVGIAMSHTKPITTPPVFFGVLIGISIFYIVAILIFGFFSGMLY